MTTQTEALNQAKQKIESAMKCHPNAVPHLLGEAWDFINEALMSVSDGAQPAVSETHKQEPTKLWCETCEGTGEVYQEHQAGCHVGGHFKCPDCDGEGYVLSRLYSTTPPQPKEPEQEPVKSGTEWFEYWNAVEGWVSVPIVTRPFAWAKLDELAQHMTSVGCGTVYYSSGEGRLPLYTTPPQRKPLTSEEFDKLHYKKFGYCVTGMMEMVRMVEAAHGIKENT